MFHESVQTCKARKVLIAGGCGLVGNICLETVMELEGDPITLDIDPAAHYSYDLANRYVVSNLPAKIGPVDVVINCQVGNQKPVANPADHFEEDIASGLTAVFNVSHYFSQKMQAGVILNFGSDLSHMAPDHKLYPEGYYKPASYSAVKAGIIGLTRYFAVLYPNIRCNCLCPGGIDVGQKVPANPLGRLMKPNELKGAIALLISDAGSYINGAVINVDGGRTAI